jgi:hypothetical protein
METFNGFLKVHIVASHGHDDHMRFMDPPVVEARLFLDGASSIALRDQFLRRRETDQTCQKHTMHDAAPIYDFFLGVNENSLQSVLGGDGTREKIGYVNLVQADWPPAVD